LEINMLDFKRKKQDGLRPILIIEVLKNIEDRIRIHQIRVNL